MAKATTKSRSTTTRPVVYKSVTRRSYVKGKSTREVTAADAAKWLGWEEESEGEDWGVDFHIRDTRGKKIRLHNDITNRPIYPDNYNLRKQTILRGQWKHNFEPLLIGRTGLILNGQHQLIALKLADQECADTTHWDEYWPKGGPTIPKDIVFGVEETPELTQTLDTCRSQSIADVIYRSDYWRDDTVKVRQDKSKTLAGAAQLLWNRSGEKMDNYAPMLSVDECMAYIARHSKLLECIDLIVAENGSANRLKGVVASGVAAGLLYFMGSSSTSEDNVKAYLTTQDPSEDLLSWDNWQSASDYWVLLMANGDSVKAVRAKINRLINNETGSGCSPAEKVGTVVKGWLAYIAGKPVNAKAVTLMYNTDEDDGTRTLAELPGAGGIDLGDPRYSELATRIDPTPEEIEEAAKHEREAKEAVQVAKEAKRAKKEAVKKQTKQKKQKKKKETGKKEASKRPPTPQKRKPFTWVGRTAWVTIAHEDPWQGKVMEIEGKNVKVKVQQGFPGAGNLRPCRVVDLHLKQPGAVQPDETED